MGKAVDFTHLTYYHRRIPGPLAPELPEPGTIDLFTRGRKKMNERSGSNLKAKLILLAGVFSCSMSSAFFRYMTAPSTIAATYRLGWTVLLLTPLIFSKRETRKELLSLKGEGSGLLRPFGPVPGHALCGMV